MPSLKSAGLVVVLGVAMLLAVVSVVAALAGSAVMPIFADDFEGTLNAWTVLTVTLTDTAPTNRAIITTSPVHSGAGAAAVIRVTASYAALSATIAPTSNVRTRAWVYDFNDEASGAFESIWSPTSPEYSALVISPRSRFTDSYALRFGTQWITGPVRSPGWHQFDVIVTDRGTFGRIDGRVLEYDVPVSQTRAVWVNAGQTRTQWIKAITPWTDGPFVFDDVAVTAPPSTTDELLLAVKDDFIDLYGATDFSGLFPTLGATNTIPCLPDMRSLAGTAMAFALDARTNTTGRAAQSRHKAIQLISDTLTYGQWAYDDIHTTSLFYCNSATTLELALAAWIVWPDLPLDVRAAVKTKIVAEADRYVSEQAYPHSGYQGDSKIEENALAAEFFAIAANMFPAESHAPRWEALARCFAFHSITNQPTTACGFTTQTVYPDFKVDNHSLSPNPHYADSGLQELAGGALAYRAAGKPMPLEFASNVAQLWKRQKQDIDWGGTYYYRINADWGSQGWNWMGGSIAAFLRSESATYDHGAPLITAVDEYQFLRTRWLLNDGRVAVFTLPVAAFTETLFSPGTASQAWFLNANQVQAGFIWGYLYHHPDLLARTTVVTPSLYLPLLARSLEASEDTLLTFDPGNDTQPALSPDGQTVVFLSDRAGQTDVFRASATGSQATNLSHTPLAQEDTPVYSPDGSQIAFASNRSGDWDIYLMDADGANVQRTIGYTGTDELQPFFTPDGASLLFSSSVISGNWDIYSATLDSEATAWSRLTTNPAADRFPSIATDGQTIAFRSERDGNSEIYLMDAAGSHLRRVTNDPAFDGYPSIVPDGSGVVFTSQRSGASQLYAANLSGAGLITLTTRSASLADMPRLSRDSRQLIYAARSVTGTFDVYLRPYESPLQAISARGAISLTTNRCDWEAGTLALGLAQAYRATGDVDDLARLRTWINGCIPIKSGHIDQVNDGLLGYAALIAYQADHQPQQLAFAQQVADFLMQTAERAPDGTLLHLPGQTLIWDDTVLGAVPFLIEMSKVSGDAVYLNEAVSQTLQHADYLRDPATGLYHHAAYMTHTLFSPTYWARGNGWMMLAEVELLAALPITQPQRATILNYLQQQAAALKPLQDAGGLWHTVVNRPDFYLESSGTALIGYALRHGVRSGWLAAAQFASTAQAALIGVWRVTASEGLVGEVSGPTGPMAFEDWYNLIPQDKMELYGQGAALLLASPLWP